ncbi:MAG: sulfite exporter TauE/SafE family protein [Isosphaeraceae bacterium]
MVLGLLLTLALTPPAQAADATVGSPANLMPGSAAHVAARTPANVVLEAPANVGPGSSSDTAAKLSTEVKAGSLADDTFGSLGCNCWMCPLILFLITFLIGILAVLGGVGGGVLYVPIVSAVLPVNLDFIRAGGLFVALCSALSAGPALLRANLASLRLAIPFSLMASASAIVGASLGLALPTHVVQIFLGVTILGICGVMLAARKSQFPVVLQADRLSTVLQIYGLYREESTGRVVPWQIHRTVQGMCLFVVIGTMAGMFGMGAGWANVPTLNLLLGVPLKISVATSGFLLSIADTSAAWVYLNKGCVLPLVIVPSVVGVMLGARIGVRILKVAKPAFIRWIVIGILALSGLRAIAKGLGY